MNPLDWYGIGALTSIALAFYGIRRVPAYLVTTALIIGVFAVATTLRVAMTRPADWWVMIIGLMACAFGLLIVRVMLIRSVSLLLLGRLGREAGDLFRDDIRGRLDDMRRFRLIRTSEGTNKLTSFGTLAGGLVAVSYAVFRIKT